MALPEVVSAGNLHFAGIQRLHNLNISVTFITLKVSTVLVFFFLIVGGQFVVCCLAGRYVCLLIALSRGHLRNVFPLELDI